MADPEHIRLLREGVDSWNRHRPSVDFLSSAIIFSPDLSGIDLSSELQGSQCKPKSAYAGFFLDGINLSFGSFQNANLACFSLRGANLGYGKFQGAWLSGADLQGANLESADLTDVKLGGADLRGAKLVRANLAGADLSGANIEGTDFSDTNLGGGAVFSNTQPWGSILFPDSETVGNPYSNFSGKIKRVGDLV